MYTISAQDTPKSIYWACREGPMVDPDASERLYQLGELDIHKAISYKSMQGQKVQDVIGSSGGGVLFSSVLKDYLESNKFTGLDFYPVTLKLKKGAELFYYLVRSNNQCSELNDSSAVKKENIENPSMPLFFGYKIDASSVISDFTRPKGTTFLICNGEVRLELQSKFTGFCFKDLMEIEISR
jgi:hypothetical protein